MGAVLNTKTGTVKLVNGRATLRYLLTDPSPTGENNVSAGFGSPMNLQNNTPITKVVTAPPVTVPPVTPPPSTTPPVGPRMTWDRPDPIMGTSLRHIGTYTHPDLRDGGAVSITVRSETYDLYSPTVVKSIQNDTLNKTVSEGGVSVWYRPTQSSVAGPNDRMRVFITFTHGTHTNTYTREAYAWNQGTGIPYFSNNMTPYDFPANGIDVNTNVRWAFYPNGANIPEGTSLTFTMQDYDTPVPGGPIRLRGTPNVQQVALSGGVALFTASHQPWPPLGVPVPSRRLLLHVDVPLLGRFTTYLTVRNA